MLIQHGLTSTWVSGVQTAVSGRHGCWQPGYALAWRALEPLRPALETSAAAPRCGWLHGWRRAMVRLSWITQCSGFFIGHFPVTDLEGEGERWYLVWCQEGRAASHPGLATGMEGCYFQGSSEGLGCLALGSEGSYPPAWVATLKTID